MPAFKHIALLVDASREYGRGICRGVANFCETRDDWLVLPHERPEIHALPERLKSGEFDGVIAYIPNENLLRELRALGVPLVDVHGRQREPDLPVVESDPVALVRLALDFFQRAGFRRFAFCGFPGVFFSDRREEAFVSEIRRRGIRGDVFAPAHHDDAGEDLFRLERPDGADERELRAWLARLPRPVAILACNDIRGQQVINAGREAGLDLPRDAAVLGIDNDEVICRLCRPTLSSIAQDGEGIGHIAAGILAARLDGKRAPKKNHTLVAPLRIVERRSADTVAAEDPLVLAAARIIRDEFSSGLSVKQLCDRLACSRSKLDPLFQKNFGRSVSGEIARVRLDHASRLLLDTDLPVADIAARCGFSSQTYFCRHFRRVTGKSPGKHRDE